MVFGHLPKNHGRFLSNSWLEFFLATAPFRAWSLPFSVVSSPLSLPPSFWRPLSLSLGSSPSPPSLSRRPSTFLVELSSLLSPLALFLILHRLVDHLFGPPWPSPLGRVLTSFFTARFLWSFRAVGGSLRWCFYRSNSASDALFWRVSASFLWPPFLPPLVSTARSVP